MYSVSFKTINLKTNTNFTFLIVYNIESRHCIPFHLRLSIVKLTQIETLMSRLWITDLVFSFIQKYQC